MTDIETLERLYIRLTGNGYVSSHILNDFIDFIEKYKTQIHRDRKAVEGMKLKLPDCSIACAHNSGYNQAINDILAMEDK